MSTAFARHYTQSLLEISPLHQPPASTTQYETHGVTIQNTASAEPSPQKKRWRSLLLSLDKPTASYNEIVEAIDALEDAQSISVASVQADAEDVALQRAVVTRVVVSLYRETLEHYLTSSSKAEDESEWWKNVERSTGNVSWYFLQSLPIRAANLVTAVLNALRINQQPLRLSTFTPRSLRQLLPSPGGLRPSILLTSLYPHLRNNLHPGISPSSSPLLLLNSKTYTSASRVLDTLKSIVHSAWMLVTIPYQLTKQECRIKSKELERVRDRHAQSLGRLAQLREHLTHALMDGTIDNNPLTQYSLGGFVNVLRDVVAEEVFNDESDEASSLHIDGSIEGASLKDYTKKLETVFFDSVTIQPVLEDIQIADTIFATLENQTFTAEQLRDSGLDKVLKNIKAGAVTRRAPESNFLERANDLHFKWAAQFGDSLTVAETHDESLSSQDSNLIQDLRILTTSLSRNRGSHASDLTKLQRPSRLTLIWPKLVLVPPIALYAISWAYASRADLSELLEEAKETVHGFIVGWLLEPLKGVVNTVRANPDEGVIISKEGVAADLQSLERMTISLAKDQLNYGQEQLAELSRQIRVGDLTAVLKIYEDDIKSPVKSAITGTLLRSLFIQVQKAKVDLDQALTGIDKLLKSQELTFAFVGLAPALSIVYISGGYFVRLWSGGKGKGRFGGKKRRTAVIFAMRRIERLLVSDQGEGNRSDSVSALTSGLLLLSVAQLRTYSETYMAKKSRLREGFLQDVEDLEDPKLGKMEKRVVVERMWRCWGRTLGWDTIGQ